MISAPKSSKTRPLVFAGLCAALGVVLPTVFHAIPGGGQVFLPMHLPVLLCGFVCGPWYGLACGVASPLISSLATGMPAAAKLPGMLCELAVYGLAAGALWQALRVHTAGPQRLLRLYAALAGAMLAGRIAAGAVNAFIFQAGAYTLDAWLAASFVTAVPGILIQLFLLPVLVLTLEKAPRAS